MLEVQNLNRLRRKEASRRLAWQSLLLCLVVILAMAVSGTSKVEPNTGVAPSVVSDLRDKNKRQAEELSQWRQRFAYCKTAGNWTDVRCTDPIGSTGSVLVGERRTVVRGTSDDDDDDGGDDTTVVVRAGASSDPKEPAPKPTVKDPDEPDPVRDVTKQVEETVKDVTDNLPDVAANQ